MKPEDEIKKFITTNIVVTHRLLRTANQDQAMRLMGKLDAWEKLCEFLNWEYKIEISLGDKK